MTLIHQHCCADPLCMHIMCEAFKFSYIYTTREQARVIPLFLLSSLLISLCYWHVSSLFHPTRIRVRAITVSQRKRCLASQSTHAEHNKRIKLQLYLVIRLTQYDLMNFYRHMYFWVVPPGVLWNECCCRKSWK